MVSKELLGEVSGATESVNFSRKGIMFKVAGARAAKARDKPH